MEALAQRTRGNVEMPLHPLALRLFDFLRNSGKEEDWPLRIVGRWPEQEWDKKAMDTRRWAGEWGILTSASKKENDDRVRVWQNTWQMAI